MKNELHLPKLQLQLYQLSLKFQQLLTLQDQHQPLNRLQLLAQHRSQHLRLLPQILT